MAQNTVYKHFTNLLNCTKSSFLLHESQSDFVAGSVFLVQVSVGPFTIVKSIDNLTETLADIMSVERRGFTLSTKNIGNENIITHIKENNYCLSVLSSKYRRHSFSGDQS